MKSRLLLLIAGVAVFACGCGSSGYSSGYPRGYPTNGEVVSLEPDTPVEFIAGEEAEFSFALVATNAAGETRRLDTDLFPDAGIEAEFSFFCFGGQKIGHPVVQLVADAGTFKTRVPVPRSAVSADLNLAISPLPEDIASDFRDPTPIVVDQTVKKPK